MVYTVGLLLLPFVLMILPVSFFDNGQSVCLSVLLFNKQCYGCGMTRAIQHIIHLDFRTAYSLNKISFIVFPLLLTVWFGEIRRIYKKIKIHEKSQ